MRSQDRSEILAQLTRLDTQIYKTAQDLAKTANRLAALCGDLVDIRKLVKEEADKP